MSLPSRGVLPTCSSSGQRVFSCPMDQGATVPLPASGIVGELIIGPMPPQPVHAILQPGPPPALTVVLKSKLWPGKSYPLDLSPITSIRDAMEELKRKIQHEHSIRPDRSIALQLISSLLTTGLVNESKPIKALGTNPVLQCQFDLSCLACSKSKSVDRFIDPTTKKLQDLCAKCRKATKDGALDPEQWQNPAGDSKRCSSCKTHKPLDSFHTAYSVCFECLQKKRQRYSIQKRLLAQKRPGRQVETSGEEVSFDDEAGFQEWLQRLQDMQGYKLRLHYDRPGGGVDKHAAGHHPKDASTWVVRQTTLRGDASFRTRLYKCPCRHILKCLYHINVRTAVDHDTAKAGRVFATASLTHDPKCAVVAREMARLAREGGEIQLQFDHTVPPGPKRRLFAADVRGEMRKSRKNGNNSSSGTGSNKRAKTSKGSAGEGTQAAADNGGPSRQGKAARWVNNASQSGPANQGQMGPSLAAAAGTHPLLDASDTEYMLEGWARGVRGEEESDDMEEGMGSGGFTNGRAARLGRMYQQHNLQLDPGQQQGYDLAADDLQLPTSPPTSLPDRSNNMNPPHMQHAANPNASRRTSPSPYPASAMNPHPHDAHQQQQQHIAAMHLQNHDRSNSPALQAIAQQQAAVQGMAQQQQAAVQGISQVAAMTHPSYSIAAQDPASLAAMHHAHSHTALPMAAAYSYNQAAAAAAATMAQYGGMQWAAPATAMGQPLHGMSPQDLNQHFQGVLMTAANMPTAEKLSMLQQWMQTLQMEVAATAPSTAATQQQQPTAQQSRQLQAQQQMVQQQMNQHMQHLMSKQAGALNQQGAGGAGGRKHKKGGNAMPCM